MTRFFLTLAQRVEMRIMRLEYPSPALVRMYAAARADQREWMRRRNWGEKI